MTDEKRCAFCGSTKNVTYDDPSQGPVCQSCWFLAGDEGKDEENEETPSHEGPAGTPEGPKEGTGR